MSLYVVKDRDFENNIIKFTCVYQNKNNTLGFNHNPFSIEENNIYYAYNYEKSKLDIISSNEIMGYASYNCNSSLIFCNPSKELEQQLEDIGNYVNQIKIYDFYLKRNIKKNKPLPPSIIDNIESFKKNEKLFFHKISHFKVCIEPRFSDYGLYFTVFTNFEDELNRLLNSGYIEISSYKDIPCW